MHSQVPDFSLPNAAVGPDPFTLSSLPEDIRFVVLFFQRDHYCTNCRQQVTELADNYNAFRARDTEIVSIVPEPLEKVKSWQDSYNLPYPLLADPDAAAGDAYNQPVRFGILGKISDFFGRMPAVVIVDRHKDEPEIAYGYEGSSTFDRPEIDELLAVIDRLNDEGGD